LRRQRRTRRAVLQHPGDQIVAVGKGVNGDGHTIADDPFDREAPAVECRLQPLNDDALTAADDTRS